MFSRMMKNGRVTIPKAAREFLGVGPGDKVDFYENERGEVIVRKEVTQQPPTSPTSN